MITRAKRGHELRHILVALQSTKSFLGFKDTAAAVHRSTIRPPRHRLTFRFT